MQRLMYTSGSVDDYGTYGTCTSIQKRHGAICILERRRGGSQQYSDRLLNRLNHKLERERESRFLTTHQHILGYTVLFTLYDLHTMDSRQLKMTNNHKLFARISSITDQIVYSLFILQESRAAARKPRDAASVLFC